MTMIKDDRERRRRKRVGGDELVPCQIVVNLIDYSLGRTERNPCGVIFLGLDALLL
jgi:hypothetical protein